MIKHACLLAIFVLGASARAAEAPHFPGAPAPGELKWRADDETEIAPLDEAADRIVAALAEAKKKVGARNA